MARIDQQLALYEFFGGLNYTTTTYVDSGATSFDVSVSGINTGMYILITPSNYETGTASTSELVQVKSVSGYTVTLAEKTENAYGIGSTLSPLVSRTSSVFPWLQAIVNGDLMDLKNFEQPAIYINVPKSKEKRQYAQKKTSTYEIECHLVKMIPGTLQGDGGPVAVNTFYAWIDAISDKIRTNKTLVTNTYASGAAMKFGEEFSITEKHQRIENEVLMIAKIQIESVEQVNA